MIRNINRLQIPYVLYCARLPQINDVLTVSVAGFINTMASALIIGEVVVFGASMHFCSLLALSVYRSFSLPSGGEATASPLLHSVCRAFVFSPVM